MLSFLCRFAHHNADISLLLTRDLRVKFLRFSHRTSSSSFSLISHQSLILSCRWLLFSLVFLGSLFIPSTLLSTPVSCDWSLVFILASSVQSFIPPPIIIVLTPFRLFPDASVLYSDDLFLSLCQPIISISYSFTL